MTVAELNALKVGDYVVHIDHGVGRFGGLVKLNDNGRIKEAIKLIYKDNDILFVNVHALHRISRYKSGEGEPPKIYKLGGGAWQKLKTATKKAVKDISRELMALYAKRKASKGFAFSADGYLQQELEASFVWGGYARPAERLAGRKARHGVGAAYGSSRMRRRGLRQDRSCHTRRVQGGCRRQTDGGARAHDHTRTATLPLLLGRLRDLPVKVEYLNRTKSAKQTRQILEDLAAGKIDIIIGTHKILGKQVKFHDLGLLIIDEEQKFGVAAKEKLTQMSVSIDTLTLTATPIPRTLQFSLMGSRDLSIISTPPPNRQPIVTESHVFSEEVVRDAIEGGAVARRTGILRAQPRRRPDVGRGDAATALPQGAYRRGTRTDAGRGSSNASSWTSSTARVRRAADHDDRRERNRRTERQYDHHRQRAEFRSERPAPAPRPCRTLRPQGVLLSHHPAQRAVRRRLAPPPEGQ